MAILYYSIDETNLVSSQNRFSSQKPPFRRGSLYFLAVSNEVAI